MDADNVVALVGVGGALFGAGIGFGGGLLQKYLDASNARKTPLTGHAGAVYGVAFSPGRDPARHRRAPTRRCGCGI